MAAAVEAPLLLYSARVCPWAQRATLALKETGLKHSIYEIDLAKKPTWYEQKVNIASKVPVLQIGGEDENSTGVPRIPESGVLLELIGDLANERNGRALSPSNSIEKAQGRYFAERYFQVIQGAVGPALYGGKPIDNEAVKKGVREVESLLKSRYSQTQAEPFWHGREPGIADLSIAPFVGRLYILSRKESGLDIFAQSDLHEQLFNTSGEFSTFAKYAEAIISRPSWKETFDDEYIVSHMKKRLAAAKNA